MISVNVNGKQQSVDVNPTTPLLWVLRENIGLTGTKFGCGLGQCGACTVHLDGKVVRSCQTPILVMPDDVPAHPYAVAMETVSLAPNAEATIYPWKETKEQTAQAVSHVRTFLRKHKPMAAAAQ